MTDRRKCSCSCHTTKPWTFQTHTVECCPQSNVPTDKMIPAGDLKKERKHRGKFLAKHMDEALAAMEDIDASDEDGSTFYDVVFTGFASEKEAGRFQRYVAEGRYKDVFSRIVERTP